MISPTFILVAVICCSVCIGVAWEIYEFAVGWFAWLENGTALIGRAALIDTMKDLIVDTVGTIAAAITSYLSLKNKKGWLYSYQAATFENVLPKPALKEKSLPYYA